MDLLRLPVAFALLGLALYLSHMSDKGQPLTGRSLIR